MYQSINNFSQFRDAFVQMDRGNQFSSMALRALFQHLEDYEEMTGSQVELDVIAICCEFVEDKIDDIIKNYSIDVSDVDEDGQAYFVEEWLQQHTTVVGVVGDSIVFAQF